MNSKWQLLSQITENLLQIRFAGDFTVKTYWSLAPRELDGYERR
jgi:hypothetical protein